MFTGQFRLDVPDGEWQALSKIETPMYTREKVDPIIRVYPSPIEFDLALDQSEKSDGMHIITFKQKYKKFDPTSLLIDGEVRLPNGVSQSFSLNEQTLRAKRLGIDNVAPGVYRVKAMAFARTLTGREVMINLPEYSFTVEPIVIVPPAPTPQELEQIRLANEEAARLAQEKQDKLTKEENSVITKELLSAFPDAQLTDVKEESDND